MTNTTGLQGTYVDGKYVVPHGRDSLSVINPSNGEGWAEIADCDSDDVDSAVDGARRGLSVWRTFSPAARAACLNRLASAVEARADELATIEVRDNGKLYREVHAQLQAVPRWFRYFAGLADKIQGHTIPMEKASLFNYTMKEPLGVIGCIIPWNSPLLLGAFKYAPALAGGNVVVVKPSEHASMSTLALAKCFEDAGFPDGVFSVITGRGATTGALLTSHPGVDGVAFTGGSAGGITAAKNAVQHLAPIILELGGKSPNIVFEDAPIDAAVSGILAGVFAAAGQTCIAGSRVFVQRSVYEEVVGKVAARVQRIVVGDPMRPETELGPIANEPQFERVLSYFGGKHGEGDLVCGGSVAEVAEELSGGFYVQPTIFRDVPPGSRVAREEVFGPVVAMMPFDSEDEVVSAANDSEYGLAAGLWTNDLSRAHRVSAGLDAGTVWVNTYRALAPNMPFGGFKSSGIGSENGVAAIDSFMRTKSVWMELQPTEGDPFSIKL